MDDVAVDVAVVLLVGEQREDIYHNLDDTDNDDEGTAMQSQVVVLL
jgi:hypothetical protein